MSDTILQGQIDQKIDEEVLRIKKNLEYEAQNFKNEESFKSHQRSVKMEEKIRTLTNDNSMLRRESQSFADTAKNSSSEGGGASLEKLLKESRNHEAFHKRLFQLLDDLTPPESRPGAWNLKDFWKWLRVFLDDYMRMKRESTGNGRAEREEVMRALGASNMREAVAMLSDLLVDVKQSGRIIDKIKQSAGLSASANLGEIEEFVDSVFIRKNK